METTIMSMNRRNVLVGLGTIVAGGGAALGTGAFSSVSADRTVGVSVADDSDALLSLDLTETYNGISDGNESADNAIEISIDSLNENATTTFDSVLEISNGGSETVELSIENVPAALTFKYDTDTDLESTDKELVPEGESGDNSVELTIEVDLKNEDVPAEADVTFTATSTQ